MNIIYRVYEKDSNPFGDTILNQEVCMCNDREHFKEIMRSMYGNDIKFANSKKLPIGSKYIVIISEDCYNAEEYLAIEECTCACCGKKFKTIPKNRIKIWSTRDLDNICHELMLSRASEIENMRFCSNACKTRKESELKDEFKAFADDHDLLPETYISRESFSYNCGYIYKITKRSTGEFYIGQTKYAPIFRWGQHLKTDRFKIDNIDDYVFEVIEKVENDNLVLHTKEAYYINKYKKEFPELCLNNQIPDEEEWKNKVRESGEEIC